MFWVVIVVFFLLVRDVLSENVFCYGPVAIHQTEKS